MHKLVKRVTVIQGIGQNRQAGVVYEKDDDEMSGPSFKRIEKTVRRMLKAQVIGAQDAYQRHLDSVEKGGRSWLYDAPGNFIKASRKAMKEMGKSSPFGMPRMKFDDDEDEND
jgi:hypothetical protein